MTVGTRLSNRWSDALCLFLLPQQAGLISRVTDTVKSIVPSWLQKYFRNGEVVEGGSAAATAAAATRLAPELNSQDPPPNGNEESSPLPDGRDTPEPSTSYTGAPCSPG